MYTALISLRIDLETTILIKRQYHQFSAHSAHDARARSKESEGPTSSTSSTRPKF